MTVEPHPAAASPEQEGEGSSLASRRGVAILILLSLVQFMDVLDASILNIALPSIKNDLGFSQQSLQWVINGYILTYGGFLLLGGRMADLLGRRLHAAHTRADADGTTGELRRARRRSRNRRNAASGLCARQGTGRRLGHGAHDRRARRLRVAVGRIRRQRAPRREPARPSVHPS